MYESPLFVALKCPNLVAMLSLLIDNNADVTKSNCLGKNVVMQACFIAVQPEIVALLLQRWSSEYDWSHKKRSETLYVFTRVSIETAVFDSLSVVTHSKDITSRAR